MGGRRRGRGAESDALGGRTSRRVVRAGRDGCIDAPRNVRAYTLAMRRAGVDLRERTAFTGLRLSKGRVVGVETAAVRIATERVILTGGPTMREVGRLAGIRIPVGAVRHQVVVSEPRDAFGVDRLPKVFDVGVGLYRMFSERYGLGELRLLTGVPTG